MPTYEEMVALAAARAATEVDVWVPEKVEDRIAGKVIENGTITTVYGTCFTTTIEVVGNYVENGEDKDAGDTLIRVAWMGAVLSAQFLRMRPQMDEIVAFHYQKDVTPKSGMNDYKLIVAVVLDENGKSKNPVDLTVAPVSDTDMVNADPRTGEILTPGRSPLEPIPGEEPL